MSMTLLGRVDRDGRVIPGTGDRPWQPPPTLPGPEPTLSEEARKREEQRMVASGMKLSGRKS